MNFRSILLGAVLTVSPVFGLANGGIRMVVGTYTDAGSQGLYSLSFDQSTGKASGITSLKVNNSSYFTFSKDDRNIYAVSEKSNTTAILSSIGYGPVDDTFAFKNSQLTHGGNPCRVSADGKIALTANYSGGTISVFPIPKDGTLDKSLLQLGSMKGGPNRSRRNTPHAHCVIFAPDSYILTVDFSGGRIPCFSYNKRDRKLEDHGIATHVRPGSGLHHLVLSPNGRYAYLMNRSFGKVIVYSYSDSKLKEFQSIATDNTNARSGADIHVSPDRVFVYVSTRLKGDGATISRVGNKGTLTRVGARLTGKHPCSFATIPNGNFLLITCRDNNSIQIYSRDKDVDLLRNTHQDIVLSHSVYVKFYPEK